MSEDKNSGQPARGPRTIPVSTAPFMKAVNEVTASFTAVLMEFDKLTDEQRARKVNRDSVALLKRKKRTVESLTLMIDEGLCCKVQVQNCEFEIDDSN